MSTHDDFELDTDLQRRLRHIAADPPVLPDSLDAFAREVVLHRRRRSFIPAGVRRHSSRVGALGGLVAAVAVAVLIAAVVVPSIGPRPAANWTLRPDAGEGEWTALQWHDVTATAGGIGNDRLTVMGPPGRNWIVKWRDGFATIGTDNGVWLSTDGLTWHRSESSPLYSGIYTLAGDLLATGMAADRSLGFWRTSDGVSWRPVDPPPGRSWTDAYSVASSATGIVLSFLDNHATDLPEPLTGIYFTTDTTTWQKATLPADLAAASQVYAGSFFDGFVAVGLVFDPGGSVWYGTDSGVETHYSYRAWTSSDGLHWSAYGPAIKASLTVSSSDLPWLAMQFGRLGASNGLIHSANGSAWTADEGLPAYDWGRPTVGDGTRIVMAADSGRRFFVSEGDGNWTELKQGGDVAALPTDGLLMVLPNGVLWASAGRVYFGQALSGVEPQGTIGPPFTATPDALATPSSTPAIMPTDVETTGSAGG
jgi:hypothetical protein